MFLLFLFPTGAGCCSIKSQDYDRKTESIDELYLEDGMPGFGYVVNNHGDPKSPNDRVVGCWPENTEAEKKV